MSELNKPNVAASLFTLHKVITRGIQISSENIQRYKEQGLPEENTQNGFFNYLRAFVSVLHSHHLVEDDLVFPQFRNKLPEMPFDLLISQHRQIVPLLEEITAGISKVEKENNTEAGITQIMNAFNKIRVLWHPHIQIEEQHFTMTKLEEMLSVEEHVRLIKEYSEYSQQHSGPPFLTVPFVLYNLPAKDREALAKGMPTELITQLVPIVWKPQWQSMQPFLLE